MIHNRAFIIRKVQLLRIATEDIAEDCMHGFQQRQHCSLNLHVLYVPLPRVGMHKYVVMSLGLNLACWHWEHTIVMYV